MLHERVAMTDIDVDHWRRLQSLVLRSAKARPRVVVIHEQGRVLSVAHSAGEAVHEAPGEIENPTDAARALHEANPAVDLVAVFERDAVDEHFAAMGASWDPDEDLDAWVRRLYGNLDRDDDGIVTHPAPASAQLGLQWRPSVRYDQLHAAVREHVPAGSSAAVAVLEGGEVWATLVVGLDADHRVTLITTADPFAPLAGSPQEILDGLVALARERHGACDTGVAIERAEADRLLDEGVTREQLTAAALAARW